MTSNPLKNVSDLVEYAKNKFQNGNMAYERYRRYAMLESGYDPRSKKDIIKYEEDIEENNPYRPYAEEEKTRQSTYTVLNCTKCTNKIVVKSNDTSMSGTACSICGSPMGKII